MIQSTEVLPELITQADREAAAAIYANLRDHDMAGWCRCGKADANHIVLAFARHRTRAEPDLVEAARAVIADAEEFGILDGSHEDGSPIATLAMRAPPIRRLRAALTRAQEGGGE